MSCWANPPTCGVRFPQTAEMQHLSVAQDPLGRTLPIQDFSIEDGSIDVCQTKKVDTVQQCQNIDIVFEAQSGTIFHNFSTFGTMINELGKSSGITIPNDLVREVEGLGSLFLTIQGCSTMVSIVSAISMYLQRFHTSSNTQLLMGYIFTVLDFTPQSGDEAPICLNEPDWLTFFRNIENWKDLLKNKFFPQFSKLLSLLVLTNMYTIADLTFSIKEIKIVQPDLAVIHGSAIDVLDASINTVIFFIENIYASYQSGSIKPFFMPDEKAIQIDQEYARIITWWDLVQNGNLKKQAGVEPCEFNRRLEALLSRLKLLMTDKKGFERKLIMDKYTKLLDTKMSYEHFREKHGIRMAPFALQFFGKSDVGKTTCAEQIVDALLFSMDLPTSREYHYKRNSDDPFWSGATSDMLVIGFDDICNTKAAFVPTPPTSEWLAVNNNELFSPNMADLEHKGKVFLEPHITFCTTNVKDMAAHQYSNCPFSIQRRSHEVMTVSVKPEFSKMINGEYQGLDSAKVFEMYDSKGVTPPFDDIWTITVEVAKAPQKLSHIASYEIRRYKGEELRDVSLKTVMQYLIEQFHEHRRIQERIIGLGAERLQKLVKCPVKGCKHLKDYCDQHDSDDIEDLQSVSSVESVPSLEDFSKYDNFFNFPFETTANYVRPIFEPITFGKSKNIWVKQSGKERNFGDILYDGIQNAATIVTHRLKDDIIGSATSIESVTTLGLITAARTFSKHWDWLTILPSSWVSNPTFCKSLMLFESDKLKKRYFHNTLVNVLVFLLMTYGIAQSHVFTRDDHCLYFKLVTILMTWTFCGLRQATMATKAQNSYRNALLDRNVIAPNLQLWRDEKGPSIIKACGIVGVIYTLAQLYHRYRRLEPHGSLEPTTASEIAVRDSEDNPWCKVVERPLPLTPKSRCISPDELRNKVENNLMYATIRSGSRTMMANCLFMNSNVVLIPSHYFETDILNVTFRKAFPDAASGQFTTFLSRKLTIQIPDTDLCISYVDTGGSFGDMYDWLPESNVPDHQFTMIWRKKVGEVLMAQGRAKAGRPRTTECAFDGGTYVSLSTNTFEGLCGAVLLGQGKGSCITGIHLGGKSGTTQGCYGTLTRPMYSCAYEMLRETDGVILTGSSNVFQKQILGYDVMTQKKLHPKSPVRWMPAGSQIAYHGTCLGQTSSHSDVRVTLISPVVTDIMGEPNVWGPPKMKPEWYGWQTCLSNMSISAKPFDPDLLACAVRDYKSDLLPIFRSGYIGKVYPLPDSENMSGIPGKKFIDAINMSTSIGFPLTGPKRNYVTEVDNKDGTYTRVFDKEIMDEITRCENCYKAGERAHTIAKGCKKDEVLAKEKCRIFYGVPIAQVFLVRKYFLPLIRVLQLHPLVSECAVGINSHGPEWQQLHNHIIKYGEERLIGGDYGKYDQKLSSQLLLASLRILIDFAQAAGYTDADLRTMEAMCGDLVFALIAFNGDLIGLTTGGHISGNSLTVILNGICGSLNLRCAFYSSYSPDIPFRQAVALSTYGDDNIGSVAEGYENFNIKSCSNFLAEYGQTYTMPDKESELTDYLPLSELEYLKRKSVYCPEKDCTIGALSEKSIFKMLHCYLRPKKAVNSEKLACAINIGAALREWANHGRTIYEMRRAQCGEIIRLSGLEGLCPEVEIDYTHMVEDWRSKYDENYVIYSTTLAVEV